MMAEFAAVSARLEELRGLQRRMELGQLEPSDVPRLRAFLEGLIAEAEAAGSDGVDFERDLDRERRD